MKMSYLFIAVALAVLSVSAVFVMSSDGSDGATGDYTDGDYTFNVVDGNAIIVSYTGSSNTITIPSSVTDGNATYPVTVIGDGTNSIQPSNGLVNVTVPDSVITISASAFVYNTTLSSVTIPDSVTSIGNTAFRRTNLTEITIPDSVTSIGNAAFRDTRITTLVIEGSPTIGTAAFTISTCDIVFNYGSTDIKAGDYGLPDDVVVYAVSYTITDNYATITAVNGNNWDVINIPAYVIDNGVNYSVKVIGNGSDSIISYTQVKTSGVTLTLPSGIETISASAFTDVRYFTGALVIPDTVKTIGDNAFYNTLSSNGFTSLDLGDGVESIGRYAFKSNKLMTGTLVLPESLQTLSMESFYSCGFNGTLTLPNSITSIPTGCFYGCEFSTIVFGDGVVSIASNSFRGIEELTTLTLPSTLETLNDNAFYGCNNLSGVLIIPSSVDLIGDNVLYGTDYESLVILGSPTTIRSDAFTGTNIKDVLNLGTTEITTTSYGLNADEVRDDVPGNMYVAPIYTHDVQKDGDVYNMLVIIPFLLIIGLLIFGIYAMRDKF